MKEHLKLCVGTFFWHRQLPRLGDLHRRSRLVSAAFWHIFHLLHNIIAFQDFSEDYMLPIQPSYAALA